MHPRKKKVKVLTPEQQKKVDDARERRKAARENEPRLSKHANRCIDHIATDIILDPLSEQSYSIPVAKHPDFDIDTYLQKFQRCLAGAIRSHSGGLNKLDKAHETRGYRSEGWSNMHLHGGRPEPFLVSTKVHPIDFKWTRKDDGTPPIPGYLLRVKVRN